MIGSMWRVCFKSILYVTCLYREGLIQSGLELAAMKDDFKLLILLPPTPKMGITFMYPQAGFYAVAPIPTAAPQGSSPAPAIPQRSKQTGEAGSPSYRDSDGAAPSPLPHEVN